MVEFWAHITEGQGAVLSALITIMAAIIGVLLGGSVFRHQVTDLKSALKEAQTHIDAHRDHVRDKLGEIASKLSEIEATNLEGLGRIGGSVEDLKTSSILEATKNDKPATANIREKLGSTWAEIRNGIEKLAADPEVDGRTRAKYARIDRRSYGDLLDAMEYDGNVQRSHLFRRAIEIWNKHRSGRLVPTDADVGELERILQEILKK